MTVVRQAELDVTAWKNGRGRKADIAVGDGWFVGLAWIEQDAPFSDFSGTDRTCTLLAGNGFTLSFADRPPLAFLVPGTMHSFPGESPDEHPVRAQVVDGTCLVLNVMSARGRWTHRVQIVDRLPDCGTAVVLRGQVQAADGSAAAGPGDVVLLPHAGTASPDLLLVATTVVPTDGGA